MARFLVILSNPAGRPALEALGTVLQSAGDHVLVIELEDAAKLDELPGVLSVTSGSPGDAALKGLDDGERLFAEAWALQDGMADKARPGEGLDWDAPGFEPPR